MLFGSSVLSFPGYSFSMASFFEKLKKGMGNKELMEEEPEKENQEPEESVKAEKEEDVEIELKQKEIEEKPIKKRNKPASLRKKEMAEKTKKIKEKEAEMEKYSPKIEEESVPLQEPPEPEKIKVAEEKSPSFSPSLQKERAVEIKKEKKWFEPEGQLTVDVYQTDSEIIVQSAVAGVKPEDLDISVENDVLTIKGNREKIAGDEEKNYFYQECYWGRFSREIILPVEVDSSRTEAAMQNGILTIRIPKIEREKKRKIVVK